MDTLIQQIIQKNIVAPEAVPEIVRQVEETWAELAAQDWTDPWVHWEALTEMVHEDHSHAEEEDIGDVVGMIIERLGA